LLWLLPVGVLLGLLWLLWSHSGLNMHGANRVLPRVSAHRRSGTDSVTTAIR